MFRRKLYCVPVTHDMDTTDYEDKGECVYLHSYHLHSFTVTMLCHRALYFVSLSYLPYRVVSKSITFYTGIQWNLRTRDTLGATILSLVERLSLSQKENNTLKY